MVKVEYFKDATDKECVRWEGERLADFLRTIPKSELLNLRFFKSDILGVEINTEDGSFIDIDDGIVCVITNDTIPKGPAVPYLITFAIAAVVSYALSQYMLSKIDTSSNSSTSVKSSTNSLGDATNKPRVNERIDDIFGTVNYHTPSLWQVPYRIGVNDREVIVLLACIGRGKYAIDVNNVRDSTSKMLNIPNVRCDFYEPGSHPGKGDPYLQIGSGIDLPIGKYDELNDLVATELLPPNDLSLGDDAQWYASETDGVGTLRLSNYGELGVDLTEYFAVDSNINLLDCVIATPGSSATLYRRDELDEIQTGTLNYITLPYKNISGEYTILTVTEDTITVDTSGDLWNIGSSEKIIHNEWYNVKLNPFQSVNIAQLGELPDYDWYYTYDSETDTLSNLVTYSAQPWNPDIGLVFDNTVGIFTLPDNTDEIICNFTSNSGYYDISGSNYISRSADLEIVVQELDEDYVATGSATSTPVTHSSNPGSNTSSVFRTHRVTVPYERASVYARRITKRVKSDSVTNVDKIEWSNLYSFKFVDAANIDLGDVTLAHVYIVNNNQSRLVKELEFNLDVTRKITRYLGGGEFGDVESYATDNAFQIAIHTGLDKWIGRLASHEIDMDTLLATSEEIISYFGSDEMVSFGYDFDDSNLSYADTYSQIMNVVNCIPYVNNAIYSAYFEKPRTSSQSQVTCRNKIVGTEKRTDVFYTKYDSVEFTYRDNVDGVSRTIYLPSDQSGTQPYRVDLNGCVNELQAYRRALREYNKILYKTQDVEIQTDDFGQLIIPGMRVDSPDGTRFSSRYDAENGYRIFNGEVVEINGLTVELSEPVEFTDGEDHYIRFTLENGDNSELILCTPGSDEFTIVLNEIPTEGVYDGYERDKTKFTFCSEQLRESTAMLVTSTLTEFTKGNETHTIKGINYSANYYSGDMETP